MSQVLEVEIGVGKIRADKWLSNQLVDTTRSHVQRAFEEGMVKVNGVVASKSTKLLEGDSVEFELPEEKTFDLTPVDLSLNILFEDEHLLAMNKPAGLVVHPGAGTKGLTLVNGLLHHCKGNLSQLGGPERQGIVHRLDRGTSGVMVVAKTDKAYEALVGAFSRREVIKEYLALVAGIPDRLSGTIKKPIGRNPTHRHKMTIREDGKPAHTDWEFLGSSENGISLIRCHLHTGRTHQIRVHLSDFGFPILGDEVYGYRPNRMKLAGPVERVLLHAHKLELTHPISAERLKFDTDLPEAFQVQFPYWKSSIDSQA
ncbi:RluA family pseudouridine synthase [Opitutia bacterium ISCC 51]|nr:RluA family pseudouridine synthase [Opitutae bacterium ISCC 51]QXD26444.1 RluA family pseudouridine synthase [Opitutae bacterium ISCC 52]